MMQIRKAMSRDLECIRELTRETIGQIYPKYYPQGAVEFFLSHHCDGAILADIRDGAVYLGIDETDGIVGTVTVKNSHRQEQRDQPSVCSAGTAAERIWRGTACLCGKAGVCGVSGGDAGRISAGKGNVSETGISDRRVPLSACGKDGVFVL